MSAPTNTSAATAQALGTLPTTYTQRVDDAGTTYTTWYSFVAPASANVISVHGYGDASVYKPTTTPFDGPSGAPTLILSITGGANLPIQFPVTAGTTYFIKVESNAGNPTPANLTLTVKVAPTLTAPIGSIAVNDDTTGFPLALLSGTTDYTVLQFVQPFPAGEAGDTLANGTVLLENINDNTVDLYTITAGAFALVNQTSINLPRIRTCNAVNKFYVGNNANPATYFTVSSTGTVSGTTTLTSNTSLTALAASNDETIVYHAATAPNSPVKQWNVAGAADGANLAAGIVNFSIHDILVLGDNSVVVSYQNGGTDFKVLRYSAAGATLNTYTYGSSFTSTAHRLAYAIDDPNSFWVWIHLGGANTGKSQFINTKVSDGSALTTITQAEYEDGVYVASAAATPLSAFGMSFSCPFWILRAEIGTSITTQTFTIRRQRRWLLPSSDDNKQMQIPVIEILGRGNGLLPGDAADPPVQGSAPILMWRLSKDGGKTWLPERAIPAGLMGEYRARWRILRATGTYRNAVGEVTVSDPVDWQLISAMAPNGVMEGSS